MFSLRESKLQGTKFFPITQLLYALIEIFYTTLNNKAASIGLWSVEVSYELEENILKDNCL